MCNILVCIIIKGLSIIDKLTMLIPACKTSYFVCFHQKCFIFRIILSIINLYCKQVCIVDHVLVYFNRALFFPLSGQRMVPVCQQNVPSRCSRRHWTSLRTETATLRTTTGLGLGLGNRTHESLWDSGQRRRCTTWRGEEMQSMIVHHMCL